MAVASRASARQDQTKFLMLALASFVAGEKMLSFSSSQCSIHYIDIELAS